MGSPSVACYPTQVNTHRLNPSRTGRYSIYLPRRDRRLSWPSWPDSAPAGSRTSDLSITSPTLNHCTIKAPASVLYRQLSYAVGAPAVDFIVELVKWVIAADSGTQWGLLIASFVSWIKTRKPLMILRRWRLETGCPQCWSSYFKK